MNSACTICRVLAGIALLLAGVQTFAMAYVHFALGLDDAIVGSGHPLRDLAPTVVNFVRTASLYVGGFAGFVAGRFWKKQRGRLALTMTVFLVAFAVCGIALTISA